MLIKLKSVFVTNIFSPKPILTFLNFELLSINIVSHSNRALWHKLHKKTKFQLVVFTKMYLLLRFFLRWVNCKIVLFYFSFQIFDCPLNLILIFSLRILFKYLFPNFTSSLKVDVTRQDEKRYFKVKDLVSIKTLSKIYLIYHFMEVISCYVTKHIIGMPYWFEITRTETKI